MKKQTKNTEKVNRVSNSQAGKKAIAEVRVIRKSPLALFNILNKMAERNLSLDNNNLCEVGARAKALHGQKRMFGFWAVAQDSRGRICTYTRMSGSESDWETYCKDSDLSRDIRVLPSGVYALTPVRMDEVGILRAVVSRLNIADAVAKADAAALNARKKSERESARKQVPHALVDALRSGALSLDEFLERIA